MILLMKILMNKVLMILMKKNLDEKILMKKIKYINLFLEKIRKILRVLFSFFGLRNFCPEI